MITVLGIDPGIKHVGYAVVGYPLRDILEVGEITLEGGDDYTPLYHLHKEIQEKYNPTLVCIEEPFAGRNIRDYGKTKETLGAILAWLFNPHCAVIRPTPSMGNIQLGLLNDGTKKTDAIKREAARDMFPGIYIANGHVASALGAAMAGWEHFYKETLKGLDDES